MSRGLLCSRQQSKGTCVCCCFCVLFLCLWHAAHRLRVVFHDFGVRSDTWVARGVYLVAIIGSLLTAWALYKIN